MGYFKTNFPPGNFYDEYSVLDELLQHNDIFTQIRPGETLEDYEKFFIERGWLPKDFNFKKLYFEKII